MNSTTCTNCSRIAGPDDRYCAGCGASLLRSCLHCGRSVAPDASFCTSCGVPITAAVQAKIEDRRRITVMFIDMAGFTSFSELADPEQIHNLQQDYFATVREVVRQYGGVVEKYIGDAVMAVFGAPIATEDDPLRAVRSGLEAQRVLSRSEIGKLATFRVGVATGEALVDLSAMHEGGQAMVSGDVVATASRMQTIAPQGGVLVDDPTAAATNHEIEYAEQPALTLRGRSTPRRLFLAVSAKLHRRDRDESTPMVNRDHERGLLVTALHRMIRDRSPQLVTIFGPAGIGKSRILRELARHAATIPDVKVNWRTGHCPPFGENVTYAALAEIVKSQLGIRDTDDNLTTRSRLDTALQAMASPLEAARLADAIGPLVGLPSAGLNHDETEAAWRRFLLVMASAAPTVLVFEDMHWADDKMLRLVEMLSSVGAGVPLLIVATARTELRERRPDWTTAVSGSVSLSLGPMHDEHIATLYGLMVGKAAFQDDNLAPLVELAGGNPLYAHEFVRMLVEQGELRPIGEQWTLSDPDRSQMPQTVQAVIANRLDLLEHSDRSVLQAAAVVGTHFWPGAVAAALGMNADVVARSLDRLQQRDLIGERPSSVMEGQAEYGFRHVLVRDVCYQRLPRRERIGRHQRTADWLEGLIDNRDNDIVEVLANHRWAAHEIARTLGMDTTPYAGAARSALHRAARRAYSLNAMDAAATALDRALGLKLDEDPSLELLAAEFALFRDGDAFFDTGGIDKLKRLAKLLVAAGDEGGAARALTLLGSAAWARADRKGALSYLDEAVNRYESLSESLNQAEALMELARVHMMNFETAPAVAAAEAAEDIANRLALAEVSANARITSAMARCFAGDPAGPLELAAVNEHCRAHGLVSRRRAIQNLAWVTQEEGDLMRAATQLSEQHLLAAKGGLTLSPVSRSYQANAYFGGDWRRSISETAQALRQPSREWDHQAILSTAWIKVICGEDDQGPTIDEILASARQSGFHRPLRTACAHAALYQALKGEHEAALTLLEELEADWRQAIALPFAEWVSAAGHAAHLTGEPGRTLFLRVLGAAPRLTPWAEAAVATAKGEHLRAARIYQEIGDVSDRMLSLGWGAQAGQLGKADEAELRDFATRNNAKLLMPPAQRAKRRRPV